MHNGCPGALSVLPLLILMSAADSPAIPRFTPSVRFLEQLSFSKILSALISMAEREYLVAPDAVSCRQEHKL